MGSGQPSAPSGRLWRTLEQQRASFPVPMPSCSMGRPGPAGTACLSPRMLPAVLPTSSRKGGLGPGGGPCVCLPSQGQDLPRFSGTFQSSLLPPSHLGTEKPPPIAPRQCWALGRLSVCVTLSGTEPGPDGGRVPPKPIHSLDLALEGRRAMPWPRPVLRWGQIDEL